MNLTTMLGQKLIFGFHGAELPEEFIRLVKTYKIGNVILFQRNVRSARQIRRLCRAVTELIRSETGYPPFIVIDQEGGMVTRLPPEGVNVPCAMALAATGDPENARLASQIIIRQLRGMGANFNMAPVVDVNSNPQNPVIGVRSFSDDPQTVSAFAARAISPYPGSGVLCCAKHFPGHGDTAVDSHLGLPRVDKSLEELEELELIPFRAAAKAGVDAIMVSHVMFPRLEPDYPSTMSRAIVTGLLKEKLGYQGLIFTDCLEMLAIQDHYGTPQGTVASIQAGVDLAEISSTIALEWAAAEAVNQAALDGAFDLEEIAASVEKILSYKAKLYPELLESDLGWESDRAASRAMSRQAVSLCAGTPFRPDETTFFCGCADYRASNVVNEPESRRTFPDYMAAAFGTAGCTTSANPDATEIAAVAQEARGHSSIVLSTCNAHLFPGQLALAQALAKTGKPLMVAALRNPYDISQLPRCQCALAAYDYTPASLAALEEIFRGAPAVGRCPVKL